MGNKSSAWMILVAAMLWGTTGTAQTFAPEGAHPVAIGAIRLAIGGFSLLLVLLLSGQFRRSNWPLKKTGIAALCMACFQPLFFSGVHLTGVAIGTVVGIGSAPVLSGFIEWMFFQKRPSNRWWLATVLSVLGCVLLFSHQGAVRVDPSGVGLAMGAGLSFAIYSSVNKRLLNQHSPLSVVAVVFMLSAVLLSPLLFVYDMSWIFEKQGLFVSLHLGIMATSVAYILFAKGLQSVPSSTAVTLSLAEPLTASLLGVFVVGERLSGLSWFGIVLLLLGLSWLTFPVRRRRPFSVDENTTSSSHDRI
jgi:drug/metabolite transporter, DME family